MTIPAIAGLVLIAIVAIAVVGWLSLWRLVAIHKHASWTLSEAFDHISTPSTICTFAGIGALAAVWFLLPLLPLGLAENEIRFAQIIASIAVWTVTNGVFYGIILGRIRKPKES